MSRRRILTQRLKDGTTNDSPWWLSTDWFGAYIRFISFNNGTTRFLTSSTGQTLPVSVTKSSKLHGLLKINELESLSNFYTPYYSLLNSCKNGTCTQLAEEFSGYLRVFSKLSFKPMLEEDADALRNALTTIGFYVASHKSSVNWYEDNIRSVDDYWSKRPSKLKNTVRRKKDKLRKAGDFTLKITKGEEVAKHLADFHRVYFHSWKVNEPYPAFIDEFASLAAKNDKLRIGTAYLKGVPVAAQLWFVEQGVASIFKLAHRPSVEKQSVGSVLTAEMFNHVIEHDNVHTVDFLTGDDPYKKDWMSKSRPLYTLSAFNTSHLVGLLGACRSRLDRDQT
ncbi:GNAT family N-acetyltransferase [Thalassotalea euphylliae]|uniref:GNAT family N-acetyltransferase n=1 Tax=Thalassotalea euphylliae TaxID=1655234 RepID=UPI00364098B4